MAFVDLTMPNGYGALIEALRSYPSGAQVAQLNAIVGERMKVTFQQHWRDHRGPGGEETAPFGELLGSTAHEDDQAALNSIWGVGAIPGSLKVSVIRPSADAASIRIGSNHAYANLYNDAEHAMIVWDRGGHAGLGYWITPTKEAVVRQRVRYDRAASKRAAKLQRRHGASVGGSSGKGRSRTQTVKRQEELAVKPFVAKLYAPVTGDDRRASLSVRGQGLNSWKGAWQSMGPRVPVFTRPFAYLEARESEAAADIYRNALTLPSTGLSSSSYGPRQQSMVDYLAQQRALRGTPL